MTPLTYLVVPQTDSLIAFLLHSPYRIRTRQCLAWKRNRPQRQTEGQGAPLRLTATIFEGIVNLRR